MNIKSYPIINIILYKTIYNKRYTKYVSIYTLMLTYQILEKWIGKITK